MLGSCERSRGIPSTRSLITLRAISVVPPPMHDVWRIRKPTPESAAAPSSSVQAPPIEAAISKLIEATRAVEIPRNSLPIAAA